MKSFILIFSLKIVGAFSNMEVGEQPIEKVESFEKLNCCLCRSAFIDDSVAVVANVQSKNS